MQEPPPQPEMPAEDFAVRSFEAAVPASPGLDSASPRQQHSGNASDDESL